MKACYFRTRSDWSVGVGCGGGDGGGGGGGNDLREGFRTLPAQIGRQLSNHSLDLRNITLESVDSGGGLGLVVTSQV